MPVLVIGADTEWGREIVPALRSTAAELRIFGSDPEVVAPYRDFAKVAVGDISDGTHVGGAATGAFCAVVIVSAAHDDRDRYFATDPPALFAQWADGLADAGVSRIIVVGEPDEVPDPDPLRTASPDYHLVTTADRDPAAVVTEVVALESAVDGSEDLGAPGLG
jgi:hypothetical protein